MAFTLGNKAECGCLKRKELVLRCIPWFLPKRSLCVSKATSQKQEFCFVAVSGFSETCFLPELGGNGLFL